MLGRRKDEQATLGERVARRAGSVERVVVIGGGMVGQHFLETLTNRSRPGAYQITLFCEEATPPYDRIHLGNVIEGRDSVRLLRAFEWYASNGVEIRLKESIVEIDRERQVVVTSTGACVLYDRLVLATGSEAFRPPLPGADGPRVTLYRSLEDAERIARAADAGGRIVIAGGGLLGLEVAYQVRSRGCEVDVVERAPRLLPRQLDVEGAAVLESAVRKLGMGLRLFSEIEALVDLDAGIRVDLKDGESIAADFVVLAAGARPRDALARQAGVECHPDGGILVDEGLGTSDPAIFAIGECVRFGTQLFGFVAPGYRMGEVLARRWAGGRDAFEGASISARLKVPGVEVVAVGESLADGTNVRDLTWHEPDLYRRIVLRDGRLVGAIAVGDTPEFARLQEAVARGQRVSAPNERRFRRTGALWRNSGPEPIERWADAAIVCTCTGVTCGALRQAWDDGCHSSEMLSEETGAGTGCGTCAPLLAELAGEVASGRRSGAGWPLSIAAVTSLVLLGTAAAVGPVPMSGSVLDWPSVDFLWRDAWWKQVSGFSLVAVMVAALALPIRERLPRFLRSSFARERVVHTVLGLGAIVALGVHSGLRMGDHLNWALMTCVVALLAVGGLAGVVTGLEHRLPPAFGSALRVGWKRVHVLLFWPVPVLVLFHVLAVYFY